MVRSANTDSDRALIDAAREAIVRNYDAVDEKHTVGAALRTASGDVFVGVNVYSLHGSCAEFIAIGSAITAGHREFVALAAVRGAEGAELAPPCGNCRQMLVDYAPACEVILAGDGGPIAVPVVDLLPYAYSIE
jgi:cytidine deaminase